MLNLNFLNKKWFIVVLVLAVSVLLSWNILGRGQKIGLAPTKKAATDLATAIVLKNTKINFPGVASFERIEPGKLPKELSVLISSDAKEVTANSVTYQGGQNGVLITYLVDGSDMHSLFQSQFQKIVTNGWKILSGGKANFFAYFDLDRGVAQARISVTQKSDQLLQLQIQTLNK